MRIVLCAMLSAIVMLGISAAHSRMITFVGYLEDAVILPGNLPIRAKMGTGAGTTSINAVDIERYQENGENWVQFTVDTGEHRMIFRRAVERVVRVRRAGTAVVERPVVLLGICIADYLQYGEVNLTDRSGMRFPLLVGRNFMGPGGLVIDSAQDSVSKPVCPGMGVGARAELRLQRE